MPVILFIEKNGTIKEMKLKEIVPEELYKKASFKTADGFEVQTIWSKSDKYNISLYARKNGRPGSENKYDFPPPVDDELYFGGCILTNQDKSGIFCDITKENWNKIYEELFGGFSDLGSEDSDSDSDSETVISEAKNVPITKEGYEKDGFIVDDDEENISDTDTDTDSETSEDDVEDVDDDVDTDDLCEDDIEDISDEDEDEDEDEDDDDDGLCDLKEEKPKQKKTQTKKPVVIANKKTIVNKVVEPVAKKSRTKTQKKPVTEKIENGAYLNCSDELGEEEYLE